MSKLCGWGLRSYRVVGMFLMCRRCGTVGCDPAADLCQQCGKRPQTEYGMCDDCIVAGMRGEL